MSALASLVSPPTSLSFAYDTVSNSTHDFHFFYFLLLVFLISSSSL